MGEPGGLLNTVRTVASNMLLIIFVVTRMALCQELREVSTAQGVLQGSVQNGVTEFLGIPYATPPVGDLRFQSPRPPATWQGIRNATLHGASCIQLISAETLSGMEDIRLILESVKQSEDCLYLDVYVPRDTDNNNDSLPVLVFIHGGGFVWGTAAMYKGTYLAIQGNVVVVVINYRLGPFGFFALEHPETSGNAGLLDQVQALHWVKDNIAAFGGNPKQVTIYGESAGSFSVIAHMLSPLSDGLFHKVIASSGALSGYLQDRSTISASITFPVAERIGCDTSSNDTVLACFRRFNTSALLAAVGSSIVAWPYIDGNFIPAQPEIAFKSGMFNKVPLMIGYNDEDGSVLMDSDGVDVYTTGVPADMLPSVVSQTVSVLSYIPQPVKETATALANTYYFSNTSDPLVNLRSCLDFSRDTFFAAPSLNVAKHVARGEMKVYVYEFREKARSVRPRASKITLGALHGDDLFHVFGALIDANKFPLDALPAKLSFINNLIQTWSSFISSDLPMLYTDKGPVEWQQYSKDKPFYAMLKANETALLTNPVPKADHIWNTIMGSVNPKTPCDSTVPTSTDLFRIVVTESGRIQGVLKTDDKRADKYVEAFLGIPYARPPVGGLRFKKPQAVKPWQKIHDGTSFGKACPQLGDQTTMAEDCLTLNIWVPGNTTQSRKVGLPVFVYIPGTDHSSSLDMMTLTLDGGFIIVTVQHRVGALGYLSTANSTAPGNLGHWDVIQALKWINKNIGYFGGDVNAITLGGQTSGAALVSALMMSPQTTGLFQRVIAMSGSVLSTRSIERKPLSKLQRLAEKTNCHNRTVPEIVVCLCQLTWPTILAAISNEEYLQWWMPLVDGILLPDMPHRLMSQPSLKQVSYMGGSSSKDGQDHLPAEMTVEQAVKREMSIGFPDNEAAVASVMQLYFSDSRDPQAAFADFIRDDLYASGIETFAQNVARLGGKAYVYESSYPESLQGIKEIPHNQVLYFINFITTGDPNKNHTVPLQWTSYDSSKPYLHIISMNASSVKYRQRERYFNFWGSVFPLLVISENRVCLAQESIIEEAIEDKGTCEDSWGPSPDPRPCTNYKSGRFNATKDQLDAALIAMIVAAGFFLLLSVVLAIALCVSSRKSSSRSYRMNNGKRNYSNSYM